jgi:hypothetical protein
VSTERAQDLGLDLVLVGSGPRDPHRGEMPIRRHPRGAAHDLDLVLGLDEAARVERLGEVDDRARPEHPEALTSSHHVARREHARVHPRIATERVVEAPRVLEVARKLRVEVSDRKGCVGVEITLGALDAGARPIPRLALGVARSDEQHEAVLAMHPAEHRDRLRLVVAREVEEVRVLPVRMLDVVVAEVHRRGRDHRDVARDPRQKRLAAAAHLRAQCLARCERVRRGRGSHGFGACVGGHARHSTAAHRRAQGRVATNIRPAIELTAAALEPATGQPRQDPRTRRAPHTRPRA